MAALPTVPRGARKVLQQGGTFYIIGDERQPLHDAYHTFLQLGWTALLSAIAAGFFVANLVFAVIYLLVGGVYGVRGDSFLDALSFSVQTMATIGYGVMHPASSGATTVMIIESMVGIIVTALATGLVFAKFSRPTTRVAFSKFAVVTSHDGEQVLMFRVSNRRRNVIVEAQLHVVAILTTTTAEGEVFYRAHDLSLVRDRQVGMTRGWSVMHRIDDRSPLYGRDAAALATAELELHIALTGIDDTSMATVHAMHQYTDKEVRIGYRFVDTLTPLADGALLVDLRNFDVVVPETTPRASVRA